jgi:protein TonB
MSATMLHSSSGLPAAPGDLRPGQGMGLVAGVLLVHAAVAVLVLTHRPAPPAAEPPPITVELLSASAEPAPPPPPAPPTPVPPPPVPTPPVPQAAPRPTPTPPVLASRQPASPQDMVVPQAVPEVKPQPTAPVQAATPAPAPPAPPAPAPVAEPRPPAAPKVMAASDADYLVRPQPVFPRVSRELGEQGTVRLRVLVDEQGRPREIEVAKSSGFSRLDQAAISALRATRFKPYQEGGVALQRWVLTPVTFNLEEQ